MILKQGHVFTFSIFEIPIQICFFACKGQQSKNCFYCFFRVYTMLITMTKTFFKKRFNNYLEYTKLTTNFQLLSSTHIPGWLARCLLKRFDELVCCVSQHHFYLKKLLFLPFLTLCIFATSDTTTTSTTHCTTFSPPPRLTPPAY